MHSAFFSRSYLIEEKCRLLSNFSQNTAEVELPGELLLPRHSHYHIRIVRFIPRVAVVQKHNTANGGYRRGEGAIAPPVTLLDKSFHSCRVTVTRCQWCWGHKKLSTKIVLRHFFEFYIKCIKLNVFLHFMYSYII